LVAGLQLERGKDGVDARCGVVDEHQVVAPRADECGKLARGGAQRGGQFVRYEIGGARFHAVAPARLLGQHHARRRAVRAVVDVEAAEIEGPEPAQVLRAGGGGRYQWNSSTFSRAPSRNASEMSSRGEPSISDLPFFRSLANRS